MNTLPHNLYRVEQVRELDRIAIEEYGVPGSTLMERAGRAVFQALTEAWPTARRLAVVCGAGNNGGDGYVVARLAHDAGLSVRILQVVPKHNLHGAALAMAEAAEAVGVPMEPWSGQSLAGFDVVIDALLGTGIQGTVRDEYAAVIEAINIGRTPVIAADLPSGLNADNGEVLGSAVQANLTVTFIGLKQGLFTGAGPALTGSVLFDDLGVPETIHTTLAPAATRLDEGAVRSALSRRPRTAHKGDFGHLLVIGGDAGMAGAPRIAAEAGARVGAGLVSVATRQQHAPLLSHARPELMAWSVESAADLAPLLERVTVAAIGPGLGCSGWGKQLWPLLLESTLPVVIDADALNLLAHAPTRRDHWILTPHPGEAARLLGVPTAEVQKDRFAAARAIQDRYGGVCVLKGAGTLVTDGTGAVAVCTVGNPGMATGGMGDLLTGVIGGLLAQGFTATEAARIGVCLHGAAGDVVAMEGERGMLATDLLPHLRRLANPE